MAPPIRLTKGTIENIAVDITDQLENLTTLNGADLRYDIYLDADENDDTDSDILLNASGTNDGMIAKCLIDTTTMERGKYKLYITFVASPETPRLGPYLFTVED